MLDFIYDMFGCVWMFEANLSLASQRFEISRNERARSQNRPTLDKLHADKFTKPGTIILFHLYLDVLFRISMLQVPR